MVVGNVVAGQLLTNSTKPFHSLSRLGCCGKKEKDKERDIFYLANYNLDDVESEE